MVSLSYVDILDSKHPRFDHILRLCQIAGKNAAVFREPMFASSTGLAHTVEREIELVIMNSDERMHDTVEEYVRYWSLEAEAKKRIDQLSGGWRRIILLTLFFSKNHSADVMLLWNGFHFVAPDKVKMVIDGLGKKWNGQLIAFEPDVELLTLTGLPWKTEENPGALV